MPQLPKGVTFWGSVGVVMAALKLKDHLDDHYERLPNDPEAAGMLHSNESAIDLLDTNIPHQARIRREKRYHCCACCSPKCGLLWKAIGIVLALSVGWNFIKLVIWSMTPTPSGLEGMPKFKASLACADAKYIYEDAAVTYFVPVSDNTLDHTLHIRGGAVGSIILARGLDDATAVTYDMTIRANHQTDLESVSVSQLDGGFSLSTPQLASVDSCMNYAMTVYLPPRLKELTLQLYTLSHVQFEQSAQLDLEKLDIVMFSPEESNMLLPTTGIRAKTTSVELYNGWLVGDVYLLESLTISTSRSSAVANLRVSPEAANGDAVLKTVTGTGRTDITYVDNTAHKHRKISSSHRSSGGGDVYLNYEGAQFSGQIDLKDVRSWSASGIQGGERLTDPRWFGDKDGKDRLTVSSKGWVKLNF